MPRIEKMKPIIERFFGPIFKEHQMTLLEANEYTILFGNDVSHLLFESEPYYGSVYVSFVNPHKAGSKVDYWEVLEKAGLVDPERTENLLRLIDEGEFDTLINDSLTQEENPEKDLAEAASLIAAHMKSYLLGNFSL